MKIESDTIDEVIEKTIQNITKISEHKQDDLANMGKQIDKFLVEVKDNCSKEGITGITSGFNSIDRHTNDRKSKTCYCRWSIING